MVDLARKILFYDRLRFIITVAGVGFAVTLVLVQTGLFLGLMDNATCAIDHMDADVWVAAKNTPNIDFARAFPDTYVNQVRAIDGVQRADNLIVWFIRMALPSGAQEGMEVYAMEHFPTWNLPWQISEGHPEDLARGAFCMLDDSGRAAVRAVSYRGIPRVHWAAAQDHRPQPRCASRLRPRRWRSWISASRSRCRRNCAGRRRTSS